MCDSDRDTHTDTQVEQQTWRERKDREGKQARGGGCGNGDIQGDGGGVVMEERVK